MKKPAAWARERPLPEALPPAQRYDVQWGEEKPKDFEGKWFPLYRGEREPN